MKRLIALFFAVFPPQILAQAQAVDAGLVSHVAGPVGYTAAGGSELPVQAYMRVREGDRFRLSAGSVLRLVFLQSGRQELWTGPASMRLGGAAGEVTSGSPPQVSQVPVSVPQRIARAPEMFQQAQMARLGGVTVRGAVARPRQPDPALQAELGEARAVYARLRAMQGAGEIGAEVYLASALADAGLFGEMSGIVEEMRRRQPDNADVAALQAWVAERLKGGR